MEHERLIFRFRHSWQDSSASATLRIPSIGFSLSLSVFSWLRCYGLSLNVRASEPSSVRVANLGKLCSCSVFTSIVFMPPHSLLELRSQRLLEHWPRLYGVSSR